jgi:hypothetical protein
MVHSIYVALKALHLKKIKYSMRHFSAILFTTICLPIFSFAQLTGKINYEKLGISFEIPQGWKGQGGDGSVILGSDNIPGIVLITSHSYSVEDLKREAQKGIYDENGTVLSLGGPLENISENALGGTFTGTLEWQPAKAYVLGVANPYHSPGISIMAVTLSNMYTEEHEKVCKQIYNSLIIKEVDRSKELGEWNKWLSNVRLTYMDSHYSSSYTDGGISAGYSSDTKIDLCSAGYFKFNSNSNTTFSGDGVSGYGVDQDAGDGRWKIVIGASGEPSLILNFQNGEQYVYKLEYYDEKLFLNGDRFFRTTSGEYAPNCN